MKRGNTALKRGVGLASAFALAIAGAVIAAPAANAADLGASGGLDGAIRSTPIADAKYIVGDEIEKDLSKTNPDGTDYATTQTGALPTLVAGTTGDVSSFQIQIESAGSAQAFKKDDTISVSLPAWAEWQQGTNYEFTYKPVQLDDLATRAGTTVLAPAYSTPASPAVAASGDTVAQVGNNVVKIAPRASDKSVLDITFLKDDVNGVTGHELATTGTAGYLLTVTNVKVAVAKDNSGASLAAAGIVASIDGSDAETTLGYVTPFRLSAAGTYPSSKSSIELPDIQVTEAVGVGFVKSTAYELSLDATAPKASDPDPVFVHTGAGASFVPTKLNAVASVTGVTDSVATANTNGATTGPASTIERLSFEDLVVTGAKANSDVTLTLTSPAGDASGDDSNGFANSPDQTDFPTVTVSADTTLPRIAGDSRYDTAAKIAAAGVWSGDTVIIANGEDNKDGVDALAANFLAGAVNAPILLSQATKVPTETTDALKSLFKNAGNVTVYVMGGENTLSADVANAIKDTIAGVNLGSVTVKRVAGDNRFGTSAAAATEAGIAAVDSYRLEGTTQYLRTAFLASGQTNADALAAGAVSFAAHIPVLLVNENSSTLDPAVAKAIDTLQIKQVIALGKDNRVSDKLLDSLKADGVNTVRIAGENRYDTAVQLTEKSLIPTADKGLGLDDEPTTAYLASGTKFPDALAVGPLAGSNGKAVLLTVNPTALPTETGSFLKDNDDTITAIIGLGKDQSVGDNVLKAAFAAIGK